MTKPTYKHDCSGCSFLGSDAFNGVLVDWYICAFSETTLPESLRRTIIARRGDDPADYSSSSICGTVVPTNIVMAALARGLDLTSAEKDYFLKLFFKKYRSDQGVSFWDAAKLDDDTDTKLLGAANWLDLEGW